MKTGKPWFVRLQLILLLVNGHFKVIFSTKKLKVPKTKFYLKNLFANYEVYVYLHSF